MSEDESTAGETTGEIDIRPSVGVQRRDLSLLAIALIAAIGGILLFLLLDSRRRSVRETAPGAGMTDTVIVPPPQLRMPLPAPTPVPVPAPLPALPDPTALPRPISPVAAPPPYLPPPNYTPPLSNSPQPSGPPPRTGGSADAALVFDATLSEGPAAQPSGDAAATGVGQALRTRATALRQRATTVVQGTLIPAVLESAINSSQPGLARALVSRDIRGFDGSRVLIPRGSRLIGEYRSDVIPGQKRALVNWTRLIRPDGATIAMASPATDPLGQGGIAGKVDTHFLARFGGAILQSILTIGTNVATARIGDAPVILGVPNGVGNNLGPSIGAANVAPPTITVRQGTTISVFAARDLDFTAVESRR